MLDWRMLTPPATDRVRVAVIGGGAGATDWATGFTDTDFEVVHVPDVAALLEAHVARAVVFASPETAVTIVRELAAASQAPPVTLFVGTSTDDHPEARLARTALLGKREWEATFDAIVDPVALVDALGVTVRVNRGFADVLATPIASLLGRPLGELVGATAEGVDPVAQSLEDGVARTREARFERLPGVWQVTTSPVQGDAPHALAGMVVILKDRTLSKEAEERMARSSRLSDIGQLAAGVAHEINTPLASIALRAESLLRSAADPGLVAQPAFEKFPRYLKTIDEEIFRCKKIIAGLLEFSRSRAPEVRATDLNAIAEKAVDLVAHQARLRQVTISFSPYEGLPVIDADDGQMRQALLALLMNAMDASNAGGHIVVATGIEPDGRIALSVCDDGVGIAPEDMGRLFTPFFTTRPVGQGTGLGLAICHGIVAAHRGEIRVTSQPGAGARFTLVLPRAAQRKETA
jgi:two-component system NtrC family sensor kinase